MTKYLLSRLPGVLLVFGFLIIIHHYQLSVFPLKENSGTPFFRSEIKNFDIFLISSEEKPVKAELIESLIHQKGVQVKVHLLDATELNEVYPFEKIQYRKVDPKAVLDVFHTTVLALDPAHVLVFVDPFEKNIHPYLLYKIRHLFEHRDVKAVYTDKKMKPTQHRLGWETANIKAYQASLVQQINMEKIRTFEDYHQGILFLTADNFLFSTKVLDPEPEMED
jgi:hypothetical protein